MNFNMIPDTVVEALGWTLVHSVWQLALIAVNLFIALKVYRGASANLRYSLSVSALALTFALPAATLYRVTTEAQELTGPARLQNSEELFRATPRQPAGEARTDIGVEPSSARPASSASSYEVLFQAREYLIGRCRVIFPFALAFWFLGLGVFSLRLAGGMWHLQRLRTNGVKGLSDQWNDRFRAVADKLRVRKNVAIFSSSLLRTPVAIGFFKPLILVPAALFLQVDPRQLESIIAHELIHIRRHDQLVSLFQGVAEALFFYHPCVWWISKQIRTEREFAADAAVIDAFAEDRVVYATALANLEEIRVAGHDAPSLAAAADGGNLMKRIERILQNKTEIRRVNSAWSAGLTLLLISAFLLAVFSFTPKSLVNAQKSVTGDKRIAIGFVAIPPVDRGGDPPKDSDATARLIIAKLQQYKIPAIGFVNGAMISDGEKLYPIRANIVRLWRDAGLEVGVGTYKHISFYHTPYDEYVASVEKNEAITSKILAERNLKLRYFSYPYLNTGRSVEDRDRFENWLGQKNLTSVKYTFDNNEWMYSYAYDLAREDNDLNTMNEIRVAFVRYMDRMIDHYETYSRDMFGRDVAQSMVLTPSRLVADSADDLFGLFQKRGYTFISIDQAQADEAYKTPETMVGDFGTSWFDRWARTQGRKLQKEPSVDAAVWDTWQKRKPAK